MIGVRCLLILLLGGSLCGAPRAVADPWSASFATGLYSETRWRGARLGGVGLVSEAGLTWSPSARCTLRLSGLDTVGFADPTGMRENRLGLGLRYQLRDDLALSGGWMWFDRAAVHPLALSTHELQAGLQARLGAWRPGLDVYLDVDRDPGAYLLGSVARSWDVGGGWALDGLAGVGFDVGRHGGWQNALLSFDLNYPLTAGLVFGPRFDVHCSATEVNPGRDDVAAVFGVGFDYVGEF